MDACGVDDENVIRERAIRLFTYLRELAKLKTTVTRDLSAYDEVVWFHDVPEYKSCFSVLSSRESDKPQDDIWLEVRKVAEPKKPPMPSLCLRWVEDSPESDPLGEPHLRNEIPANIIPNLNSNPESQDTLSSDRFERLTDNPEVSEEWQRYIQDSWLPWSEVYRRWKAIDHLYFQLFSIYQQLKKLGERYELILGLGLLTWETPNNQVIRRHIVVGDAYLTFDADRAKFELQGAPEGVKLRFETEMIDAGHLPPLEQQKSIEALLSAVQESPWNKDEIDKVLRSWIHLVSADGVYSDSSGPPEKCLKIPTVTFAPAIILRQRTQRSQIQCFNNIIEQIKDGGNVPSGVRLLCEKSESTSDVDTNEESARNGQAMQSTLYLPLAINEEQVQIVHQLRSGKGILVQGPPGTGKSHTIANLICHLLAQCKRVLVTSQTPRALRVLKDKIPPELAALCVTLLGNDQAARQELEASVYGINQKYSEWNPLKSQGAIASLETHLFEIRRNISDTKRLLREQREIDTYHHEVAFGAYKGTAQQIACKVKDEENKFAWLDDDIEEGEPCPLSNAEFMNLVYLYRELSDDYCSELRKELVSRDCIPDVDHFVRMADDEKAAKQNLEMHSSRHNSLRFIILKQLPEDTVSSLHRAMFALVAAVDSIKNRHAWTPRAVSDVLRGNDTHWKGQSDLMRGHLSGLGDKVTIVQTLEVRLPDIDRRKLRTDAQDLLEHLGKGGKLGWKFIAPQVVKRTRYIMKQAHINGQACSTAEKIGLLVAYLEVWDRIDLLWSALQGEDNRERGPILQQIAYLRERLNSLEEILKLEDYLSAAKGYVKGIEGLAEPQWNKMEELQEIVRDILAAESAHTLRRARSAIEGIIQNVRIVQSSPRTHILNQQFLTALEERDAKALAQCLDKLEPLEKGREALLKRGELQKRLNEAAPKLGYKLQNTFADNIWNQRAGSFEPAWAWKQADKWLIRFRNEHNEIKLETELKQFSKDEREAISKLAAAKAWDNCLRSLTEYRRNNLIAWATTIKKIGKGTGKRAPMYRKLAQKYMDECKEAIPAWILPLYRVFETINPEPETFDVVVIDEASQTGPEGLVIQYLGKQCIVVGDSEQIAPEAVGTDRSAVDTMVKRYLEGIPFKDLYDPETSLFAQADIRFGGRIVLREHFRCMPEIIQFSNQLCYAHTPLKPLRQYPPKRLEPIIVQHVEDGFREGPVGHTLNRPEADELVDTIVKLCSLKEYADKTMGVISLLGEAQAKYIENKLLTRLNPTDLEKRRIVCGDAYAFQGDERDVIFLSMVAAPNERIGALVRESDKRRFNVAASRARDQMVLFHTATLSDLHPDCMRYKLLEYCLNPIRQPRDVDLTQCESEFEKDVCRAIVNKGYKVIPQYRVAEYRIDLVVEGIKSQLAVECDGDEWHGIEQYERDVARQRILERCGWRFFRIRGHEYYRDPDDSLVPLWKMLEEIGIKPLGSVGLDSDKLSEIQEHDNMTENIERQLPIVSSLSPTDTERTGERKESLSDISIRKSGTVQEPQVQQTEQKYVAARVTESEIYQYAPDFFFSLAHWAKEKEQLKYWERHLIFNIGRYRNQGWQITEKMERQALRIIQQAKEAGFSEAKG
jgi:very-short-patch-repair endonuclease